MLAVWEHQYWLWLCVYWDGTLPFEMAEKVCCVSRPVFVSTGLLHTVSWQYPSAVYPAFNIKPISKSPMVCSCPTHSLSTCMYLCVGVFVSPVCHSCLTSVTQLQYPNTHTRKADTCTFIGNSLYIYLCNLWKFMCNINRSLLLPRVSWTRDVYVCFGCICAF